MSKKKQEEPIEPIQAFDDEAGTDEVSLPQDVTSVSSASADGGETAETLHPYAVTMGWLKTPDPNRPGEKPIMATDEEHAIAQFYARHNIVPNGAHKFGSNHMPEATLLAEEMSGVS